MEFRKRCANFKNATCSCLKQQELPFTITDTFRIQAKLIAQPIAGKASDSTGKGRKCILYVASPALNIANIVECINSVSKRLPGVTGERFSKARDPFEGLPILGM